MLFSNRFTWNPFYYGRSIVNACYICICNTRTSWNKNFCIVYSSISSQAISGRCTIKCLCIEIITNLTFSHHWMRCCIRLGCCSCTVSNLCIGVCSRTIIRGDRAGSNDVYSSCCSFQTCRSYYIVMSLSQFIFRYTDSLPVWRNIFSFHHTRRYDSIATPIHQQTVPLEVSNVTTCHSVCQSNSTRHIQANRTDKVNHKFIYSNLITTFQSIDVCNWSLQTTCAIQSSLNSSSISTVLIQWDRFSVNLNTSQNFACSFSVRISLSYNITMCYTSRKSLHVVLIISKTQFLMNQTSVCRIFRSIRYFSVHLKELKFSINVLPEQFVLHWL